MRRTFLWIAALGSVACGGESDRERRPVGVEALDAPSDLAEAPPPPLAIPSDAPTVLFMGDSIGAGLHLAEHQAFPAVAQRLLFERGVPFELVNASESGRTSAGGASAIDWSLRVEPDVVVIELGGNDGLRGITLESTEENLRKVIEASHAAEATVLLLGVRMPENHGPLAIAFDAIYPRLADEYDLDFVPFYMEGVGAVPGMNLPDGLHPNPDGHLRLAENIQDGLQTVLQSL